MKIFLCRRICTGVGRSLGLLEPAVATAKATAAFAELDLNRMNLFYMIWRKGKHCNKVFYLSTILPWTWGQVIVWKLVKEILKRHPIDQSVHWWFCLVVAGIQHNKGTRRNRRGSLHNIYRLIFKSLQWKTLILYEFMNRNNYKAKLIYTFKIKIKIYMGVPGRAAQWRVV